MLVGLIKTYKTLDVGHVRSNIICSFKGEHTTTKCGKYVNTSISRASLMTDFHLPTTDKSNDPNFEIRDLKFICTAISFSVSRLMFKILAFHP